MNSLFIQTYLCWRYIYMRDCFCKNLNGINKRSKHLLAYANDVRSQPTVLPVQIQVQNNTHILLGSPKLLHD